MEEKELILLSRLAVNHLFLCQFEPLRAILLVLHRRNPRIASAVLLSVIFHIPGSLATSVLWSTSCSSPALFAWLLSLILIDFHRVYSIDNSDSSLLEPPVTESESILLYTEFLLYIHQIRNSIKSRRRLDEELEETQSSAAEDVLEGLDWIETVGFNRLRDHALLCLNGDVTGTVVDTSEAGEMDIGRFAWMENAMLGHTAQGVLDALYCNIQRQTHLYESCNTGSAIVVWNNGTRRCRKDSEILSCLLHTVKKIHMNAIREYVEGGNVEMAIGRIRFLHLDNGSREDEWKDMLRKLLKVVSEGSKVYGEAWNTSQKNLLAVYEAALSSGCMNLIRMIQDIRDELISEEIEARGDGRISPAVERVHLFFASPEFDPEMAMHCFTRDMYHFSRVSGTHILESLMDAALLSVKNERYQEASNILLPFPRLQPLVAAMGWDLLSGKATARRSLMKYLWTGKAKDRFFDSSSSSSCSGGSTQTSCIENLCDVLCYRLDFSSFVASVNAGKLWNPSSSVLDDADKNESSSDTFVENLILERLSIHSPLRVLFDVVPGINFDAALEVIQRQPTEFAADARGRTPDIELMHTRYAVECAVSALRAMSRSESEKYESLGFSFLRDLQKHFYEIKSIHCKLFLVNMMVSLLHMDDSALDSSADLPSEKAAYSENDGAVSFIKSLLHDTLMRNLPSSVPDEPGIDQNALCWIISRSEGVLGDWQWRLSLLERLGREWRWNQVMLVLRASPSGLLDLCMKREAYDIAEEIVQRFRLSPEDRAALSFSEWVDSARSIVEDPVGTSGVHALRGRMGSLPAILLCIDVALCSSKSAVVSRHLLEQAELILSEIYPGAEIDRSSHAVSHYWDHVRESCLVHAASSLLKRLFDLLEREGVRSLRDMLSGEVIVNAGGGQRERALSLLHQIIADARAGKRQFLSGKLHNLSKAIDDEEREGRRRRYDAVILESVLKPNKSSSNRETAVSTNCLSRFILHVATIGDVFDAMETTHDFNFFSLLHERPKDLLIRLFFECGNSSAAVELSRITSADLVHEVISSCIPPIYPPRSRTERPPIFVSCTRRYYPLTMDVAKRLVELSPVRSVLACFLGSGLQRGGESGDGVHALNAATEFTRRTRRRSSRGDGIHASNAADGIPPPSPDSERLFYEFSLDNSERFPALNRWMQMQTVRHRVIEFGGDRESRRGRRRRRRSSLKRFRRERGEVIRGESDSNALFDSDGEAPFEKAVERLISEGKLEDALSLSDRFLSDGASDRLLALLIASRPASDDSWKYCLRLKDKRAAARLSLEHVRRWDLGPAIDVLTMCVCHLQSADPLAALVVKRRRDLLRYRTVLRGDGRYRSWQAVESDRGDDAEGLVLRLAERGSVSVALEIAETEGLSTDLRRELQSRRLVGLLTADPLDGGGLAEASRYLSSLPDALPVVVGAMPLLPDLHSKRLLVHFFLKQKNGREVAALGSWELGFRVLTLLPPPWQQRCSSLHEHPSLILEVLLMTKQLRLAASILKQFPSMHDDGLITCYAAKSITVAGSPTIPTAAAVVNPDHTFRRFLPASDEWMLTGEKRRDDITRSSHAYGTAPDVTLFRSLLSLCTTPLVAAGAAVDLCVDRMKEVLSRRPDVTYRAATAFVQGLRHARSLHGAREIPTYLLTWLHRAELLQSLLGSGIPASLDDVTGDPGDLRDRLIAEERYGTAVRLCSECGLDAFPAWNAWGHALVRTRDYARARVKFKRALGLCTGDPEVVVLEIVNAIEDGPPADVLAVFSLYNHLEKSTLSRMTVSGDSLSADSYLDVLHMPSGHHESDGTRHAECLSYLREYAPRHVLAFLFRHGRYEDACSLFLNGPSTVDDTCELFISYGAMPVLYDAVTAASPVLTRICGFCETHGHFNHLYRFQCAKKDHAAAGLCCIQLFVDSVDVDEAAQHLENAREHFEEALSVRFREAGSNRVIRGTGHETSEEELVKLSARVSVQVQVSRSLDGCREVPQWKHSVFGNPNDAETFGRRCRIAEALTERNFDLAFRVIYEFGLPAADVYAAVASSLAEKKGNGKLMEVLRNVRGTIGDDEWDQVVGVAISVCAAGRKKEGAERLIDMLRSSHRKVMAHVLCGRLKPAFQIASRNGSVADVQYVAHQALHSSAPHVLDMCREWLLKFM